MRLNSIRVVEYRFMLAIFALLLLALSQSAIPANDLYPQGNKEIKIEPDINIGKGRFGCSVATNGKSIIVVGAEAYRGNKGIAFVYERSGQEWPQSGRLRNPSGEKHDSFGQSVDVSGVGYIAVGAPGADIRKKNAGKVVVYKKEEGEWKPTATLTAKDASENAEFGAAVSFYGKYLVVGAPGAPCRWKCCKNHGAVYVFKLKGKKWKQVAKITYVCNAGFDGSRFGHSVAIHRDTIVVGAPGNGGLFWIYKQIGKDKWKLVAGGRPDYGNEKLGWSVDVFGNRIVVGDPGYDGGGCAWILERPPGGDWQIRPEEVTPQDPSHASNFGYSVSISGSKILVGDPGSHETRGSVDRWRRPGKNWRFDKTYKSEDSNEPGNSFGHAVDNGLKIQVIGVPGYKKGRGLVIIKK